MPVYAVRYTTPVMHLDDVVDQINQAHERIVSVHENGSHEADFGQQRKAFLVVVELPAVGLLVEKPHEQGEEAP